jgi:hypothetical protein
MPMNPDHTPLPDGRHICTACHRTAVYEPPEAQALFQSVAHVVIGQLGLGLSVGVDLTLVDQHHLQRLMARASAALYDDPTQVMGLFVRRGHKRAMYILYGLPRILLIQTIAHEWGHAWQGENCPLLHDPLVREGFAEWVAYKTLQTLGAVKRMALMEQQDGLYGQGLRDMLRLERSTGLSGVLSFCRQAE